MTERSKEPPQQEQSVPDPDPPTEMDMAINSIIQDSGIRDLNSKLDLKDADKPLACSDIEIDSAISSILGFETSFYASLGCKQSEQYLP